VTAPERSGWVILWASLPPLEQARPSLGGGMDHAAVVSIWRSPSVTTVMKYSKSSVAACASNSC